MTLYISFVFWKSDCIFQTGLKYLQGLICVGYSNYFGSTYMKYYSYLLITRKNS